MQLLLIAFSLLSETPVDSAVRALKDADPQSAVRLLKPACPTLSNAGERGYCLLLLGMSLQGSGRKIDALAAFRSSVELLESAAAPHYREALSMSYRYWGELVQSEELLRKALSLQTDRMLMAATHRRLADLLAANGRAAEAEDEWRIAASGFRLTDEALAVERVELEASRARILMARGLARQARPVFFEVLQRKEAIFGTLHPRTAAAMFELGFALQAEGEVARAEPVLRRAAWIEKRVAGGRDLLTSR